MYAVACISTVFIFMAEFLSMVISQKFIHSSIDGRWCCSLFLADKHHTDITHTFFADKRFHFSSEIIYIFFFIE